MAPLPIISDVIRAAFQWTDPVMPRHAVNVMHFHIADYNINALHASIESHVAFAMWSQAKNTSSITSIVYTPLDGHGATIEKATSGGTKWTGNGGTADLIPQVAVVVKLLTDQRGRSRRGRLYMPWVCETVAQQGVFQAASQATMQSAWNSFGAGLSTDLNPLVVASYRLEDFALVTSQTVESQLATQRRRQPRPR